MEKLIKKALLIGIIFLISWLAVYDANSGKTYINQPRNGYIFQHYSDTPQCLLSEYYSLNKGKYTWKFYYTASEPGNEIVLYNNEVEFFRKSLETDSNEFVYEMNLDETVFDLGISFMYGGSGYFEMEKYEIIPNQRWYNDSWLKLIGLWIVVAFLYRIRKGLETGERRKEAVDMILVFAIACLPSIAFLKENPILVGHDLDFHLSRIDGIVASLQSGYFPARIYPNMVMQNGNLGTLYPDLFLYIPAAFRLLGISPYTAYKAFMIIINFATAFIMYFSVKSIGGNRKARILASLIYVFMSYRLHDLYVRAALGEVLAMVFVPILIVGLYHLLAGDRRKWWLITIGATGIVNSHIISAVLWATISVVIILMYSFNIIREKRYIELFKVCISSILVNLFYIVPFLVTYTHNELNLSVLFPQEIESTQQNISYIFGIIPSLFPNESNASLHYPLVLLSGVCFLSVALRKVENSRQKFMNVLTVVSLVCLYISSSWFPYEVLEKIPLVHSAFDSIQFMYRMIGPTAAMITVSGVFALTEWKLIEKHQVSLVIIFSVLILVDATTARLTWPEDAQPLQPFYVSDEPEDTAQHINNKIKCNLLSHVADYYVVGDKQFNTTYELSNEDTNIIEYSKDKLSIDMVYQLESNEEEYAVLPLMRYYGYKVVDELGVALDTCNSHAGTFQVPLITDGEEHEIHIEYREPVLFVVSGIVSLISIIVSILWYIKKSYKRLYNPNDRKILT